MKKILFPLITLILIFTQGLCQQPTSHSFTIPKKATLDLQPVKDIWKPTLRKRELPKPHSGIEHHIKEQIKDSLGRLYPKNQILKKESKQSFVAAPGLLRNFQGNSYNFFVPNDNDMAISDSERVCSVTNTTIWSKNLKTNIVYGGYTLHSIMLSLGLQNEEFDPKIMYDPQENKFILVCLNGFTDQTSHVVVGFSQTDSTNGLWNFYALPGNPLNNSLWTDFPMMAITQQELFITGNLLYNDSSWQTGFNETIIWQINKNNGYTGNPLNAQLHNNIFFNGGPLRNLCPAKGGSQLYGPSMTFLSNRNFSPGNDTIFMVTISDTAFAPGQTVTVDYLVANTAYHMPVDADQPFVDKLAVNDARILGAYYENGKIQFVASTLDTASGNDAIYHGIIQTGAIPTITTNIYSVAGMDMAYPNISYAGTASSDSSIIVLLQSSSTVFPGAGAVLFDGSAYSPVTTIKSGISYVNVLIGTERWGDYTGSQRKYDSPGIVWVSGGYGASASGHFTHTWIAELSSTTASPVENLQGPVENTSLYPNPATEKITVAFTNPVVQTLKMEVIDLSGKHTVVLFSGKSVQGPNEFSFSITDLAPGNYFIRITGDQTGPVAVQQFAKP